MANNSIGKRKFELESSIKQLNKKTKMENSKDSGKFTEDCLPEGTFSIGNDIFVRVATFNGNVAVHVRQYVKHGKFFYPTSKGVTLRPCWVEYIMGLKKVPISERELLNDPFIPERQFQITSEDFKDFCFKRMEYGLGAKQTFKEITISHAQWGEMIKQYDAIITSVLDHVYRRMNLLEAFKKYHESPIEKELPPSLDNSLGKEYLVEVMKKSLCDLLKQYGLKEPAMLAEELWANSEQTFNSFSLSLEEMEIAESFYSNLWDNQKGLLLKPIYYVTSDFFNTLRLDLVLRESRKYLCPEGTFEYFNDEC